MMQFAESLFTVLAYNKKTYFIVSILSASEWIKSRLMYKCTYY